METTGSSPARRPIASRQSSWARAFAGWLVRQRVAPNHISIASVAFAGVELAKGQQRAVFVGLVFEGDLVFEGFDGAFGVALALWHQTFSVKLAGGVYMGLIAALVVAFEFRRARSERQLEAAWDSYCHGMSVDEWESADSRKWDIRQELRQAHRL